MDHLRVPGRKRLEHGDRGLSLTRIAGWQSLEAAASRTVPHPGEVLKDELERAASRPRAGNRTAATASRTAR